ncbi:MAG: helix-turn-helix transcriptional regulator [Rikenellaceae bacterium]|nr:helix-turn-helix transcriptional regulator [Rikenellaceae bacterium]
MRVFRCHKLLYLCKSMNPTPKIAVIHPNSLCCMAMRTILSDIAPFMGATHGVEIATYNSAKDMQEDNPHATFLYFVAYEVFEQNIEFFEPLARRCIVLTEGKQNNIPAIFRTVDIQCPERELIKAFLMIHNAAHHAHGIALHSKPEEVELLSQREKDVLSLIVKGYINKEIADMLNISTPTVIFHRRNISEKIGSKSVGRLTIYAVMNGIVDVREL